ncbi:MAG: hypothetical protein PF439_10825 [Helicobacteraceae bacterium]|jgi:hypothetical protein|nr:hypothetical protein [Helicobacteraceae bacterium]
MVSPLESIIYLIKVQQAIVIDNKECCYDEIIAQCTDLQKARELANTINGKIEKHTEPLNNFVEESVEQYN